MKSALYQFNPLFGEKERNIENVLSAVRKIEADLIVLPEFFATGYQFASLQEVARLAEEIPGGLTTEHLCKASLETGAYIVAGLPERAGDLYFNSALLTGPEGLIGVYRKSHLFLEEKLFFTKGDTGFRVWDTPIGRIGIMICFDWFFPESMRTLALAGAEVVAHPSNLVLPYCPQAMPIRCLENRVFAVTANRVGVEKRKEGPALTFIGRSLIVSPKGQVLASANELEEAIVTAEISPAVARNKTVNEFNDLFEDRRTDLYRL